MTQTPKQPIYKYTAIPTDEHFNPDRPSLELACRGNRTMGNILNFLVSRASYIAENKKLESCKVVTINVARDEILKAIRISEKTYITYLKELNELHYVDAKRYARREYDVNFEAINEGIKNPPAQKLRGRPKGSKRQCKSGSNKSEENTSTLQENTSTYVLELEKKVEVLSEKVKVLQLKVESITTFEKVLPLLWKVLQLSQSDESIPQALREAFSKPLDVLDVNEITNKDIDVNADALTHTHSSENDNQSYPQSNTSSPQDIHSEPQASVHIAKPTPQTDALVGVATRNTESLVNDVPPAPDTSQQNGSRKPRTPKVDPDLQKRIEAVLVALDECAREVMGDADFTYRRTKVATEEITSLLKERRVTREDLHAVYLKMWNTPPDPRTGFDWKKNMTVKAFCNNFDRMIIQIKGNAKQNGSNGTGNTAPTPDTPSVLGVSGQRHFEFAPLPHIPPKRKAR